MVPRIEGCRGEIALAMQLGYNTNGFAHHGIADALEIIAEIGYQSVAVTLEPEILKPTQRSSAAQAAAVLRPLIERHNLSVTIETGARFILDPRRKHWPTLLSGKQDDRRRRIDFLKVAIDIAGELSADSVSLWSGRHDEDESGLGEEEMYARLTDGLSEILQHAQSRNVRLAFEPEPDMFIDTMVRFERMMDTINHPFLGLTLDVGHIHCLGDGDVAVHVSRWRDRLWNVHIEDMRVGVHEHLALGDGEINFPPIFAALGDIAYAGPVHVELSRHSHDAVNIARQSFEFLHSFFSDATRDVPSPPSS